MAIINQRSQTIVIQTVVDGIDANMGVDSRQLQAGGGDFRHTDARIAVQDLALQIGKRDGIEINQRQLPDARGSQIGRRRAAQAAQADHQHMRRLQLFLAVEIKAAQHDLAVIAQRFCIG